MGVTVALLMVVVSIQSRVHAARAPQTEHGRKQALKVPPGESGPVLYKLASEGKEKEVRALLSTGGLDCVRFVDPGTGYSALWIASAKGHLGIVRALVEASADVNWGNKNDATPLLVPSQQGELEVVRALLGASAEV